MNYEFGYSMLFLETIGFVAEFCGKVARSVYGERDRATLPQICRKTQFLGWRVPDFDENFRECPSL